MIACSEAVERLWSYLEQELGDHDRDQLEEHLVFCRRCCGELEFARELRGFLRDAGRPRLPAGVEDRLTSFLDGLGERDPGVAAPTETGAAETTEGATGPGEGPRHDT